MDILAQIEINLKCW